MRKEKLIIDFLRDKRLGRHQDYSIPANPTFLPLSRPFSGRLIDGVDEGCDIART